jgi:hypothetical protein
MIDRRSALAALAALAAAACASPPAADPAVGRVRPPPLRLDPLTDLVAAAGLVWLIDMKPRDMLAAPALAEPLRAAAPDDHFEAFAIRLGGIDLRQADELVLAAGAGTTFGIARLPVDPPLVEAAFARRAVSVEGRAQEQGVIRLWGTVGQARQQIAIFGDRAAGMEVGAFGPLRTASYFAQGRLRRAAPALAADPLALAATRLGPAPVRAFAPGPFEGSWAGGLGGLLGATTALAAAVRPAALTRPEGAPALALQLLLMGAWGGDAPAAAERLESAFRLLGEDPLGRLTGLDRPVDGPRARGDAEALVLDVALDPGRLAGGVGALAGASLAQTLGL